MTITYNPIIRIRNELSKLIDDSLHITQSADILTVRTKSPSTNSFFSYMFDAQYEDMHLKYHNSKIIVWGERGLEIAKAIAEKIPNINIYVEDDKPYPYSLGCNYEPWG